MGAIQDWHRLVGRWEVEGSHPKEPDVVIRGGALIEWFSDQNCLVHRAWYDHSRIPDALMVTAVLDGRPRMNYFDYRGRHREYLVEITSTAWRWWTETPGIGQRWSATFAVDGSMSGQMETCRDGDSWTPGLALTYRR